MKHTLRPKQTTLVEAVFAAWHGGASNVLGVSPTGSGKTVMLSHIIEKLKVITCAIAHRAELVGQMSLALARNGIRHRVMAQPSLVSEIQGQHMLEFGRRFIDPHSDVVVAGVQTLINRSEPWMERCGLWVVDEAHHLIQDNVWGKAIAKFPQAKGLGFTAIPSRADGKGLGRHADGVMDVMVQGAGMQELIQDGHLTPYRIFAPPSDLDLSDVKIGASGEYVGEQVRKAVHRSHITGDIVQHYLRIAPGKRGLTFTVDVESAEEVAAAYRAAGVPAEMLSGKSPTAWRMQVMRKLRSGELLQVVNCDLLGEGTDVPAVEVVSMGRPTASYQIFGQQFGRMLRPFEGKAHGILIDHVNNVRQHGLPDAHREWSLDRRDRRARSGPTDVVPVTTCTECSGVYERIYSACPYCAKPRVPARRDGPQFVDGDLAELDANTLRALRGEQARIDAQWNGGQKPTNPIEGAMLRQHLLRQDAQRQLRDTLGRYGGWRVECGDNVGTQQRRFYLTFGIDVMSAQALGAREALDLQQRVEAFIAGRRVPSAREPATEAESRSELNRLIVLEAMKNKHNVVSLSQISKETGLSNYTIGRYRPEGWVSKFAPGGRENGSMDWIESVSETDVEKVRIFCQKLPDGRHRPTDIAKALNIPLRRLATMRPDGWRSASFKGGTSKQKFWVRCAPEANGATAQIHGVVRKAIDGAVNKS